MQKTVRKHNPSRDTKVSPDTGEVLSVYPHFPPLLNPLLTPSLQKIFFNCSFFALILSAVHLQTSSSFFPQPSIPNPVTNGKPFPFQTSFCIDVLEVSSRAYHLLIPHFYFSVYTMFSISVFAFFSLYF